GWFLRDDFLTLGQVLSLRAEADALHATGRFTAAGVGRSQRPLDASVRSDQHVWLDPDAGSVSASAK
ncbi:MAG TPA: hypothetical protein VH208_01150, partial [Myxococcaceae bacterium]|nr:hypothetical protein [Myxococcaceae bacterium]